MRAASANSLQTAETVLQRELLGNSIDAMEVAENLYGVSDLLRTSVRVRMALTDPGREAQDKAHLVEDMLATALTSPALKVLQELARGHWSRPDDIAVACETLGNQAVFFAAEQAERLESLEAELFAVHEFLSEHRQLRIALTDLGVGGAHERAHFAAQLFADSLSPYATRLLRRTVRLSEHGRLTSQLRSLIQEAALRRQQMVATVTSAQPLQPTQIERLRSILEARYRKVVSINTVVDPQVLGGLSVEVGQHAINATVRSKIAQAKRELSHS